jgi:osmotically-inducible protein OsmY
MTIGTTSRTDDMIRRDVEEEFRWVPGVDADSIGVGVNDGIVTLSGQLPHLWLRHEAGVAALRIRGVKGLANEIEVVLAGTAPTDADIAGAIAHQLRWTGSLPEGAVIPEVRDGVVTLRGVVGHNSQRQAVERETLRVRGVRRLTNEITLSSRASAEDTKERIAAALKRNAVIDVDNITVQVDGTEVTLSGHVGSWDERHQAERTAWTSPHVTSVRNHLAITLR